MNKRIVIIQGHPDADTTHFCHVIAQRYADGAADGGHAVRTIEVAKLDFTWLRAQQEWQHGTPPPDIIAAQQVISWADQLLIVYPLWMGGMPAMLHAFLEQVMRPGFALTAVESSQLPQPLLTGKSARVVITMGMPGFVYRWYFGLHSLKALRRNILRYVGIAPIRRSVIGAIDSAPALDREKWLRKLRYYGQRGM